MTEDRWLKARSVEPMLKFLRYRVPQRTVLHFGVADILRRGGETRDRLMVKLGTVLQQYAEGTAHFEQVEKAAKPLRREKDGTARGLAASHVTWVLEFPMGWEGLGYEWPGGRAACDLL